MKPHSIITALFFLSIFTSCNDDVILVKETAHWEYENTDWENLGYSSCSGNSQSPVNIEKDKTLKSENLPEVIFNYSDFEMKIVDNSHTIQINGLGANKSINFNEIPFEFIQFHLHHKSEHQINNEHSAMELHAVHQDQAGNLLVLGFMIEAGNENQLIENVLNNVPEVQKVEIATGISINLSDILPDNKNYYTYSGSLTTPPCSAAVNFVIFKEPIQASSSQIIRFANYYSNNHRPIQPLNNRFVLEKIEQ